eukprot:5172125-Pyramimonas_sp.AAC.1
MSRQRSVLSEQKVPPPTHPTSNNYLDRSIIPPPPRSGPIRTVRYSRPCDLDRSGPFNVPARAIWTDQDRSMFPPARSGPIRTVQCSRPRDLDRSG